MTVSVKLPPQKKPPVFSQGFTRGWFPKGWFLRMFPQKENRNKGTFRCSPGTIGTFGCAPGTKIGTSVRLHVTPERPPERGHIRQNHPFTKPPFCLPVFFLRKSPIFFQFLGGAPGNSRKTPRMQTSHAHRPYSRNFPETQPLVLSQLSIVVVQVGGVLRYN